ncbi:Uncharacterized protein PHSC3_001354 [Chlamydiales bacterium STE3]|nr:Uncharacterized protein PHSC3_001354 [Chlamydiales bacterium STE3]
MGSLKVILSILFFIQPISLFSDLETARLLYLIHSGEVESALNSYLSFYHDKERHDFELLQKLSLTLLDRGLKSNTPEEQLLTIYGAGVSSNEKAFYLLEEALNSPYLQIQAVALNFLAKTQSDYADALINRLITSPHPLIRLEAAYQLALKKHPWATPQIEALMHKMGSEIASVFPKLFATCGDAAATKVLRKLLSHPKSEVRCETILSLAEFLRDDLLVPIRRLALHNDIAQQEACAAAFGAMKDEEALPLLRRLATNHSSSVKIAAIQALNEMQETSYNAELLEMAKRGDVFAIYALKDIPNSEDVLHHLTKSTNLQIRLNASLALLHRKSPKCLRGLKEILIKDSKDLALVKIHTQGKGIEAFKAVPSLTENVDTALLYEMTLGYREEILEEALNLPEEHFLNLAAAIFATKQNELVPALCNLLYQLGTPSSIALLKKEQQRAGAPLIRSYCNLALFKLKEEGPYEKNLLQWVNQQQNVDMIRFRAFVPFDLRENTQNFELTPEETARLLIDSFEVIAQTQEDKGINLLLDAMIDGNPKNRYVLAGLLLRITQ